MGQAHGVLHGAPPLSGSGHSPPRSVSARTTSTKSQKELGPDSLSRPLFYSRHLPDTGSHCRKHSIPYSPRSPSQTASRTPCRWAPLYRRALAPYHAALRCEPPSGMTPPPAGPDQVESSAWCSSEGVDRHNVGKQEFRLKANRGPAFRLCLCGMGRTPKVRTAAARTRCWSAWDAPWTIAARSRACWCRKSSDGRGLLVETERRQPRWRLRLVYRSYRIQLLRQPEFSGFAIIYEFVGFCYLYGFWKS